MILEERNGRISREELASVLNYDAHYLNRIVNQSIGMSLLEYGRFGGQRCRRTVCSLWCLPAGHDGILRSGNLSDHSGGRQGPVPAAYLEGNAAVRVWAGEFGEPLIISAVLSVSASGIRSG